MPVIMLTAIDRSRRLWSASGSARFDYWSNRSSPMRLLTSVQRAFESIEMKRELEQRRRLQLEENRTHELLGTSEAMDMLQKGNSGGIPVRFVGSASRETGTGKELAAVRFTHSVIGQPVLLFAINCGAIPKDLFETNFLVTRKAPIPARKQAKLESSSLQTMAHFFWMK